MSERIRKTVKLVLIIGIVLSVGVILLIYGPIVILGIGYRINRNEYAKQASLLTYEYINENTVGETADLDPNIEFIKTLNNENKFGIVIPTIGVRAFVKENIDPYDEDIYMPALTDAVAHAKGTKLPGEGGKIFIFAHSAMNFYRMTTQNIDFYLLNDLDLGDKILLTYKGEVFMYKVNNVEFVAPETIAELESPSSVEVLKLMTCWPPGVDLKRLVVTATLLP